MDTGYEIPTTSALAAKAPLASPTFTGTVTAPTIIGTDTTDASSSTTGALKTAGGLGVAKKLYVGTDAAVGGNLTVTGNLTINGTTTTVNSTAVTLDDPIITLGGDTAPTSDDNKDRGVEFRYHDGTSARLGFFGYDDSAQNFVFLTSATNTSEVFTGTKATIDAYLSGSNINAGTVAEARIDSAIARLASPTFTGTPAAPTASTGTNTTQIATTAFVAGVQSLGGLKTIDTDTSTHTLNIGSGTTSSGQTKTINIGTGGAAGSDTKINIGPSTYGHYTRIEIGSSQTNGASYVILGNSNSTNSYVLLQNGRIDCLPVGVNEGATFKIPHGETPDSGWIENGDIWTTTTGMFVRINGSSQQLAPTSGKLSQFASTTSSELLGIISDETGSGSLVFGTSPTLSQPIIDNPRLGYATTVTAAGTTTLTATSSQQQYLTGTTTQTIKLPDVTTLALGQYYEIHNNSTGAVTVQSSGSNTIYTVPANTTVRFTCILITGTTAASWDYGISSFNESTEGIILKSANGTRYRISVADDGSLTTTAV